jgi:hypothetical protein
VRSLGISALQGGEVQLGTWEELSQGTPKQPLLGKRSRSATSFTPFPDRAKGTSAGSLVAGLRSLRSGCRTQRQRISSPRGQKSQLGTAIIGAADDWEDWHCGNRPRPGPHVIETAGEMLAFAGTLGPVRCAAA